jgi:hypothetical protein
VAKGWKQKKIAAEGFQEWKRIGDEEIEESGSWKSFLLLL